MNIGFANNTESEINVKLFPKNEFLRGDGYYYNIGNDGGGYQTEFTMKVDSVSMYSFKYVLFSSKDTTSNPEVLLSYLFDSIYFSMNNSSNIKIVLTPDSSINMNVNPFIDTSVWTNKWIDSSTPDNDCENQSETKMFKFYIETEYISGG
jgi:hypothetical protein